MSSDYFSFLTAPITVGSVFCIRSRKEVDPRDVFSPGLFTLRDILMQPTRQ